MQQPTGREQSERADAGEDFPSAFGHVLRSSR
jgi:hypothetical protein